MRLTSSSAPVLTIVDLIPRKRSSPPCQHGDDILSSELCKKPTKRIKFATHDDGSIRTSEKYLDIRRSEYDKPNLWFSKREREIILSECERSIRYFRENNLDDITNYLAVYDKCSQAPSRASSDFLETAKLCIPDCARGMEWGWASSTKKHRSTHVQELLEFQGQIQGLNAVMRGQLLSSRSLRSSRPGRIMARLVGESDAAQNGDTPK